MTSLELIEKAKEAMKFAYAPYSHFSVGAAILTDTDVFLGCNVENSSYGCAICAERTAAVKAVSNGQKNFKKIAVVSSSNEYTYPCGICRQFISEFASAETEFIFNNKNNEIKVIKYNDILPYAFTEESMK